MNKMFKKISLRQSIYISKRISFLLEAGVSLPKAFLIISQQMKRRGAMLEEVSVAISQGRAITDVISRTKIFGASVLPMIKIGEESGTLAESFSALSDELEKRALLTQKIIGAILYPACITIGMLVLVILLMVVVFPKMISVFESLHVALPLSTRILIGVSNFINRFGFALALFLLAVSVSIGIFYKKYYSFHLKVDRFILKIPLVSALVRVYALASTSNVIGLLLKNHSSLLVALRIAGQTCGNYAYREVYKNIADQVSSGVSLGHALEKFPKYFSEEYCSLVSIGEQTGKLSETFLYMHTLYARDLDALTKSLSASIEPILMIGIGLAIGVVAFSIITPMYDITSHLHGT